jgi:hypothetical protein
MTTLQLIENKVPELTQNELLILLEKVVHSLKSYSIPSSPVTPKPFNPEDYFGIWKAKDSKTLDEQIKQLRSEWDRNIS